MLILILQIILAFILVGVIIVQNRGNDAGIAFGAGGQSYRSKKGLEKFLFYTTIFAAVLFACISILAVII